MKLPQRALKTEPELGNGGTTTVIVDSIGIVSIVEVTHEKGKQEYFAVAGMGRITEVYASKEEVIAEVTRLIPIALQNVIIQISDIIAKREVRKEHNAKTTNE